MKPFLKQFVLGTCVMFTIFMTLSLPTAYYYAGLSGADTQGLTITLTLLVACIGFSFLQGFWFSGLILKKLAYPLKYEAYITEYAQANALDPYLVCGAIHTESHFDMEAESRVGAIGLMQIMPDTGEWIAKKMSIKDYSQAKLKDPETNIRMGCWYLKYLMDKFDGDMTLVLAGYNAGPNRVTQWLEDEKYSQDGKLTDIPYQETEEYVKKVQNAKEMYESYYTLES